MIQQFTNVSWMMCPSLEKDVSILHGQIPLF